MVSWAVTGATRGIGLGFVTNLSNDPQNEVFALIRSLVTAGPLEALAAERKNIHIVVTDLSDPKKLEHAANEVFQVTGGSLDVLLLNAGSTTAETGVLTPSAFHGKEEALEDEISQNIKVNVISNIYTMNAFLDLIRNGTEKKIAFVSSQSANVEFTRITGMATLIGYSIAKAGMNMVMTKFGVELAQEGIKTISISPGWVNTDAAQAVTGDPEVRKWILNAFHKIDQNVEGPRPVEDAVADQLRVIKGLTEEDSGRFVTHHGNDDEWF